MSSFRVEPVRFSERGVRALALLGDERLSNWPVVYTLDSGRSIYVGETGDALKRLKDHLASASKRDLRDVRIVIGEEFNKSVCLDLESRLINLFAGDGKYQVLNGNGGQADRDYYGRDGYRESFDEIFEALRARGPVPALAPRDRKSRPLQAVPVQGSDPGSGHRGRRDRRGTDERPRRRHFDDVRGRRGPGHREDRRGHLPDEAPARHRARGSGRSGRRGRAFRQVLRCGAHRTHERLADWPGRTAAVVAPVDRAGVQQDARTGEGHGPQSLSDRLRR